jgi:hypothetical protein
MKKKSTKKPSKTKRSSKQDICLDGGKIKEIYFIEPNDIVWDHGKIVRLKRKYGKFKRTVFNVKF